MRRREFKEELEGYLEIILNAAKTMVNLLDKLDKFKILIFIWLSNLDLLTDFLTLKFFSDCDGRGIRIAAAFRKSKLSESPLYKPLLTKVGLINSCSSVSIDAKEANRLKRINNIQPIVIQLFEITSRRIIRVFLDNHTVHTLLSFAYSHIHLDVVRYLISNCPLSWDLYTAACCENEGFLHKICRNGDTVAFDLLDRNPYFDISKILSSYTLEEKLIAACIGHPHLLFFRRILQVKSRNSTPSPRSIEMIERMILDRGLHDFYVCLHELFPTLTCGHKFSRIKRLYDNGYYYLAREYMSRRPQIKSGNACGHAVKLAMRCASEEDEETVLQIIHCYQTKLQVEMINRIREVNCSFAEKIIESIKEEERQQQQSLILPPTHLQ